MYIEGAGQPTAPVSSVHPSSPIPPDPLHQWLQNKKSTVNCIHKLKALNHFALKRETSDKRLRYRPLAGFPQASSALLHAVSSTPQCSEQAFPRIIPEQGIRVGVSGQGLWSCANGQSRIVSEGEWDGHDKQKIFKALKNKRKKKIKYIYF